MLEKKYIASTNKWFLHIKRCITSTKIMVPKTSIKNQNLHHVTFGVILRRDPG